jgi:hypothetical protein
MVHVAATEEVDGICDEEDVGGLEEQMGHCTTSTSVALWQWLCWRVVRLFALLNMS